MVEEESLGSVAFPPGPDTSMTSPWGAPPHLLLWFFLLLILPSVTSLISSDSHQLHEQLKLLCRGGSAGRLEASISFVSMSSDGGGHCWGTAGVCSWRCSHSSWTCSCQMGWILHLQTQQMGSENTPVLGFFTSTGAEGASHALEIKQPQTRASQTNTTNS